MKIIFVLLALASAAMPRAGELILCGTFGAPIPQPTSGETTMFRDYYRYLTNSLPWQSSPCLALRLSSPFRKEVPPGATNAVLDLSFTASHYPPRNSIFQSFAVQPGKPYRATIVNGGKGEAVRAIVSFAQSPGVTNTIPAPDTGNAWRTNVFSFTAPETTATITLAFTGTKFDQQNLRPACTLIRSVSITEQ